MIAFNSQKMCRQELDRRATYQKMLHHKKMDSFYKLVDLIFGAGHETKEMRTDLRLILALFSERFPNARGKSNKIRRTLPVNGDRRISVYVTYEIKKNAEIASRDAKKLPNKIKKIDNLPMLAPIPHSPKALRASKLPQRHHTPEKSAMINILKTPTPPLPIQTTIKEEPLFDNHDNMIDFEEDEDAYDFIKDLHGDSMELRDQLIADIRDSRDASDLDVYLLGEQDNMFHDILEEEPNSYGKKEIMGNMDILLEGAPGVEKGNEEAEMQQLFHQLLSIPAELTHDGPQPVRVSAGTPNPVHPPPTVRRPGERPAIDNHVGREEPPRHHQLGITPRFGTLPIQ